MMEALRFRPPATNCTYIMLTKDTQIGKYKFKANDDISVNFMGLHFNQQEWKNPYNFIPERFDNENEASLTPSGKKRNPYSWLPFNAGKRICFGKTFAELNLKIIAVYLTQYFNFELLDKKFSEIEFPILHAGMSNTVPI